MPVVYRISHRVNYATVNLVNALARFLGYRAYHYLTTPYPGIHPERGFFATEHGFDVRELAIDDLRNINRLAASPNRPGADGHGLHGIWPFDDAVPDLLVINQGSGITPRVRDLFPESPKVVFYAECFTISDFYPRPEWPMPAAMSAMNDDYRRRAIAYAEQADAIVVPSRHAKSLWPEAYHSKIHPLFEGFDVDHLAPERILALTDYGKSLRSRFPGKKLVAFIGETIEPIRGFDAWMEVCLALRKVRDDVQFIVVSKDRIKYGEIGGVGLNGIASYRDWVLERYGMNLEDMPDICWLDTLPLYDYLSLLAELDVVIYPMYGMFANWSLFHALHMGVPVVASDRAYLPEAIRDGINGFLVDPDDSRATLERVLQLLDSDTLRAQFAKAGRETVEQRYALRNTADRLAELLAGL